MFECLIVGDSIGVGVFQQRPECVSMAQIGINSKIWNKKYLSHMTPARTLIISLGANDSDDMDTEVNVRKLRIKADASRVFWILPNEKLKPDQVKAVRQVAKEFGDTVLTVPERDLAKDGLHITALGYKKLAQETK
jgi:lysophospholipase L1-like esterase